MYNIVVIMSTYNGADFLREQIDSIMNQSIENLLLYVRDDGSSDDTMKILHSYESKLNIIIQPGSNIGAKKSFMEAIFDAPEASYYALSDQDDIWDEDKLECAIKQINSAEPNSDVEVLYHSSVNLADENGRVYGKSGFYNIQRKFLEGETGAVTGCTAVFNHRMMQVLRKHKPEHYVMHDGWIHKLCLAIGGTVIYDPNGHISYRQHANNVVGGSRDFISRVRRRRRYWKSLDKMQYTKMYNEILDNYEEIMPLRNIERCKKLCSYSKSWKDMFFLLRDRSYFSGRFAWKIEMEVMILLRRY